jgi:hypothetical protein
LRENAEFFQFPPIQVNSPNPIINVITIQEMRDIFFFDEEGEELIEEEPVEEEPVEEEIKTTTLSYYHVEDEEEAVKECGICLADDIKRYRMVKLNCGHEFCDKCTNRLITQEKSCCALCRAEITNVEVMCGESYGVLKDNSKITNF